jgi:glycosyltransferase involved in cell wall biosynthesis
VRELGLEDQVVFTGQFREEDKARLLSGSTAFIFPSLYEGFGIPALEAMKCGAPLITSNTSSLPEVVGDGGLLIDPTNESSITEAIGCLLDSPDRRDELSERAQERASHFSWRQVAEQTLEVYRRARAA